MVKIKQFWQLPIIEKWLLIEASFFLVIARLTIQLIPFKYLAPFLGKNKALSNTLLNQYDQEMIGLVGHSIQRATNNLPWHTVCLPRAMAAKFMLRRRKIGSVLYLGVNKNESSELGAHAWTKAGNQILTGEEDIQNFTVIASFI
jgi:hypothetical protein